jgi:hypothetical protein
MPQYRVYFVGREGRFSHAEEIECDGDQEAIEQTQQFADGYDVELWERGRFIRRFAKESPLQG